MKAYGEVDVYEVSGQLHSPAPLPPEKESPVPIGYEA
jgi:hypothetical protein